VACDGDGLPVFDRLRYRRDDRRVFLYAFDLIELDGEDLRRGAQRSIAWSAGGAQRGALVFCHSRLE
jgi:hypothetical protein